LTHLDIIPAVFRGAKHSKQEKSQYFQDGGNVSMRSENIAPPCGELSLATDSFSHLLNPIQLSAGKSLIRRFMERSPLPRTTFRRNLQMVVIDGISG
jgi:hypothetical protein